MKRKILVAGSRKINNQEFVFRILDKHLKKYTSSIESIITGGAIGVDRLAMRWAKLRGFEYETYYPEFEKYGKKAPIIRNKIMVHFADIVIVIWDGKSKGSLSTINFAKKKGEDKPLVLIVEEIIYVDGQATGKTETRLHEYYH